MIACMGGWCTKRSQCPHYTEAYRMADYEERLCLPGHDGIRLVDSTEFRKIHINVFETSVKMEAAI